MARMTLKFLLILVFGLAMSHPADCLSQETSFESMELAIPAGWKQLPGWAAENLPFDATQYYGIPNDKNREQLYLKAFMKFSILDTTLLIPNRKKYDDELARRCEDERVRDLEFYEYCDRFFESPPSKRDQAMMAEGRKLIQHFQPGFDYLKLAQKKPRCFFHAAVDTATLSPHLSRESVRKLSVRCNLDLSSEEAIEVLKLGYRLGRISGPWAI